MMPTGDDIVNAARKYIGVRWLHQGRNRINGLDCVGLLVVVAQDLGLSNYDFKAYQRHPVGGNFLDHFDLNLKRVDPRFETGGDITIFKESAYPYHTGFLTNQGTLVHSSIRRKSVVEEPYDHWQHKRCFAFRFPHLVGSDG